MLVNPAASVTVAEKMLLGTIWRDGGTSESGMTAGLTAGLGVGWVTRVRQWDKGWEWRSVSV